MIGLCKSKPQNRQAFPELRDECFRLDCLAGELDLLSQKKKTTEKNKQYKLNTSGAVIGIMLMYNPEVDPEKLFFSFTRNGELITKGWRSETISKRL